MVIDRAVHVACKHLMGSGKFTVEEKEEACNMLVDAGVVGGAVLALLLSFPDKVNQDLKCWAYDNIIKWNAARLTKEV